MNLNRVLQLLSTLRTEVEELGHQLLLNFYRVSGAIEPYALRARDTLLDVRDFIKPRLTLTISSLIVLAASLVVIKTLYVTLVPDSPTIASINPDKPVSEIKQNDANNLIQRFTVLAIDAGHGGVDPGSLGINGIAEKDVTLALAKAVREELSSVEQLHVALTRYDDRTININSRNEIIEEIGADFVLSLHLNSIPQDHISLVESYYKVNRRADPNKNGFYIKSSDRNIEESRLLATAVQNSVFQTVKRHNKISVNAGLKTQSMRILSQNKAPGALIEITCLSNPEEAERLASEEYVDKLAVSIAEGIKLFLKNRSESVTAAL